MTKYHDVLYIIENFFNPMGKPAISILRMRTILILLLCNSLQIAQKMLTILSKFGAMSLIERRWQGESILEIPYEIPFVTSIQPLLVTIEIPPQP